MRRMVRSGVRLIRSGSSRPASSPHSRTSAASRSSPLPASPPTRVSHIPGSVDLLRARRATHSRPSGVQAFRCTALVGRPKGRSAVRSITPSLSSPATTSSSSSRQPRRQLASRNSIAARSSTASSSGPGSCPRRSARCRGPFRHGRRLAARRPRRVWPSRSDAPLYTRRAPRRAGVPARGAQRGIQVGQLLVHLGTVLDEGAADFMPLARAASRRGHGAGPTKSRGLNYICLRVRYNPPVSL